MRKIFVFLALLLLGASAAVQPVTLHELPENMRSYKNYIVVFVHGMGSSKDTWADLKSRLSELVGDPSFAGHLYAYTLDEPYAAFYGNAAQLGDRSHPDNWLDRARREFIATHPDWPADKIPKKFIFLTHSMGSLAARSYIYSDTLAASGISPENFPNGFYQNDVKKVIFIAPTHRGSSMADFLLHYMASDDGYKFGASGILRQILQTVGLQTENFATYARNRNTGQPDLPVINEIALTEESVRKYLLEFIRADFTEVTEPYAQDRAEARLTIDVQLKQQLKDRLFEYTNVQTAPGKSAPILSADWFQEQTRLASVFAIEKLADCIFEAYQAARGKADDIDDLLTYVQNLNLQSTWDKYADRINTQLGTEGFAFNYRLKVDKNWPSNYVPAIKLTYRNWNNISLDWNAPLEEIFKVLAEYRFSVKLTKDTEYKTSLLDLVNKYEMLTELYSPLPRLFQVIAQLDTAPLLTFPSAGVFLEVNNYCSSAVMKELLDFMVTEFFQKRTLEGGAVTSLLADDPVTSILNAADLPKIYDPVEYRNVSGRGGVAFDRRTTKQFNQFFYGDLPALQGAFKDTELFQNNFFSTALANGYQLKLLSSPEYQRLPSGEARLTAFLLSYARGVFTKEGDGAVDIDSLSGKNIPALSGAQNYYRSFSTPALSNYVDQGFLQDTVRAEAECVVVELAFNLFGGTTPPFVRGAIRLTPLFNFIAQVVNYKDELLEDINAHSAILRSGNSLGLIEQSVYDNPLLVLNAVYTVSGNEITALEANALQDKTDNSQAGTTVPLRKTDSLFYLPLAYNVKAPKLRLNAELYDFAPQLAKVEYSFNFSPFTAVPVDEWGAVTLPDFSVAEGQNIILFKLTNKLGRQTEQFLRIIRSSTPLLASEIFPAPQSSVATNNFVISTIFYNAQFITNNTEVSDVEAVILNGNVLPRSAYTLTRASNSTYQNFLKLEVPVDLAEGRHSVTLKARDTYGHNSETNWFFEVDLTPPEILLGEVVPVQASQNIEINYELRDNSLSSVLQDVQLVLSRQDKIIWQQSYALAGTGRQQETISINGLTDGEYVLEIAASDLAGNRTIYTGRVLVDSISPRVGLEFNKYLTQQTVQTVFTVSANEEISGQIILFDRVKNIRLLFDLDQVTGNHYAVTLNALQQNIPDAVYTVILQIQDLAGNQSVQTYGELLVHRQGPQISSLHTEPAVLNRNSPQPYQTKISAVIADNAPTDNAHPAGVYARAVVYHKSTGLEMYSDDMDRRSGIYTFTWDAANARYPSGAYLVRITATDTYGNKNSRECEIIKDGIAPEISLPANGAAVNGLVLISGKVSDSDWSNTTVFESYTLYWAAGFAALPANFRDLDKNIWQTTGLETPYVNRNGSAQRNISYRAAPEDTLLCLWDTADLSAGAYTILLVSAEKDLGSTAGIIRHIFVEPALENKTRVRIAENFTAQTDFARDSRVTFNILNSGSTANISTEIIDKYGQVIQHNFWPNIPGILYNGRPAQFSDGAYLWQDDGWHLYLISTERCSFNILLGGAAQVTSADLPYTLNSGILQLSGYLEPGELKKIKFELQDKAGNFYINAERYTGDNSVWLRIGPEAYTPQTNSYVQTAAVNTGVLSLTWDGRLASDAYADNGEYTLQVLASGLDSGIARDQVTFNITTPFVIQNKGVTPADGRFAVLGELNKITFAYTANKDHYLSAAIIDQTGVTISILPVQKNSGSPQTSYLSWNGSYPQFDSKQRFMDGTYRAVLTLRSLDGEQQTLEYNNIQIQNDSRGTLASLEPLGETVLFNGQQVQAVTGSSEYYWSARGEGTYTVPKTFSYELGVSGSQIVTAAPFVPFAGLYHRGFDRINLIIEIAYKWSIDYRRSKSSNWQSYNAGSVADVFYITLTSQNQVIAGVHSPDNGSGFKVSNLYEHNVGADYITVTIKDTAGNVMFSESRNGGSLENTNFCNGVFDIKVSTYASYDNPRCHISSTIDRLKLKDDIKYSRLTNRYYAWFGYVSKYYPQEFQFSKLWADQGRLGFVPSSYFMNGFNSASLNVLFQETYPKVLNTGSVTQNKNILESLQKLNVIYDSMPYTDESYYNYLADEYCEFIPMTSRPVYFVTENQTISENLVTKVSVYSDQTITTNIPWPATEEYIVAEENKAKALIEELAAKNEIDIVNYADLPLIFDKQSIDFGGLGFSRLLVPAALGKKSLYQRDLSELAALLPKYVVRDSLSFTILKAPSDINISFDSGLGRTNYSASANVQAHYATALTTNVIPWSTEQDFFLKNGVIDSPPLIFNEYGYAPDSGALPIYEAYFATLNRRADLPTQNITPIDYYTFLAHDYYDPNSGYTLNPNLDFERWTIQAYDQTGQPNQDLSVADISLSNTQILENNFKIKLNLDAVEKRYVRIFGSAAGEYELMYFDGEHWQTICTGNPTAGFLGWWEVTRLNGSYTVALKVMAQDNSYSLAKQDVHIGQVFHSGDDSPENKLVASPYKRAEVRFHSQSYSEDKFITVAPIKLKDLRLQNQPELYTLGPIAEILPHGSEFPDPDKRPTVIFRYSQSDLAELRLRGVDIGRMGLYYINESGALEKANSEHLYTEQGLEIWTVLDHFSPYTILDGDVPELPSFNIALHNFPEKKLKVFGRARPDSLLEVYLDDSAYFDQRNEENIVYNATVTTNVAAWIFNRRNWDQDYAAKLAPEQREKISVARNLLQEMYLAALAENHTAQQEYARQYAALITDDQARAENIRQFLLASNQAGLITGNSGIRLLSEVELQMGLTAPTLNNCLPERLEIILQESVPLVTGGPALVRQTSTDAQGYFALEMPLNCSTASVFVTYVLTGNIHNRPLARRDFREDKAAPNLVQLNLSSPYLNIQNDRITADILWDKEAKLIVSCYDTQGELIDLNYVNAFLSSHTLTIQQKTAGDYYYTVQAIDPAGNQSQAYGFTLTADFTPPRAKDIYLPQYINPQRDSLQNLISLGENIATFSLEIKNWEMLNDEYVEQAYPYVLTVISQTGNTATFNSIVTVDTTAPVLDGLEFGPQLANGVRLFWLENEPLNYTLTARQIDKAESNTYNIDTNYYYDERISTDSFYLYTLQANDLAGNTSNIIQRLVYTADDTAQIYALASEITLNHKNLTVSVVNSASGKLFVLQNIERTVSKNILQPGTLQLSSIYRVLNSAWDRSGALKMTLAFNPRFLAENYIKPETMVVLRYANGWTSDGIEIVEIDQTENTVTFKTNSYGEYALFGGQESWVYDHGPAQIRFVGLRDNDYLDISVTLSADVRDDDTAINTQNIWFMLDNVRYDLVPENIIIDPLSYGRVGRISFNLQRILSGSLTDGQHILDLYVLDQLGHTANAELKFTTTRGFQIDSVHPAPNPFGTEGMFFTYQLSKPANSIEIKIYDVNGRLVRVLDNCSNQAGYNKTKWDGKNRNNMFVANDVYFYVIKIDSENGTQTIKGKIAALR